VAADPDLRRLIAPVPFGVPDELPVHRPLLPARDPGDPKRILFGGLYDWYDPFTLLDALERLPAGLEWRLLLIENPNPGSTPQRLWREVESRSKARGWWGTRVETLPWVPAERRYDLLRDVDVLAAPHRRSLETRLSLRTRFLDALAAGCPVITSEGGAMARLLTEHGAGRAVPEGDAYALARALEDVLTAPSPEPPEGAATLLEAFRWERALAPLVAFCRAPWRDDGKDRFGHRPPTVAPADRLGFRLRRRARGWLGRLGGGGTP
jgi:glycosyltransferase involved in cell wall biosynthesis